MVIFTFMFKLHDTKMDMHVVMDMGRDKDISKNMAETWKPTWA
jgi:hypothetical protein